MNRSQNSLFIAVPGPEGIPGKGRAVLLKSDVILGFRGQDLSEQGVTRG